MHVYALLGGGGGIDVLEGGVACVGRWEEPGCVFVCAFISWWDLSEGVGHFIYFFFAELVFIRGHARQCSAS